MPVAYFFHKVFIGYFAFSSRPMLFPSLTRWCVVVEVAPALKPIVALTVVVHLCAKEETGHGPFRELSLLVMASAGLVNTRFTLGSANTVTGYG